MTSSPSVGRESSAEPLWPKDGTRRADLQRLHPAERAILDAITFIETLGGDVRLTDAVVLLSAAQRRAADWVDSCEGFVTVPRQVHEPVPGPVGRESSEEQEAERLLIEYADAVLANGACRTDLSSQQWHRARAALKSALLAAVSPARALARSDPHEDVLFLKVEAAIKVAGELGSDLYDFIEGRGLKVMREEIRDDIAALRARASHPEPTTPE